MSKFSKGIKLVCIDNSNDPRYPQDLVSNVSRLLVVGSIYTFVADQGKDPLTGEEMIQVAEVHNPMERAAFTGFQARRFRVATPEYLKKPRKETD